MKPEISVVVKFLSADEGGRKNALICLKGYRPHFRVINDNEYLGVQFIEGPEGVVIPQVEFTAKVRLIFDPDVSYKNLNNGKEFDILEGARIVGKGIVIG